MFKIKKRKSGLQLTLRTNKDNGIFIVENPGNIDEQMRIEERVEPYWAVNEQK